MKTFKDYLNTDEYFTLYCVPIDIDIDPCVIEFEKVKLFSEKISDTETKYFLCFYNEYRKEPRKEKFGEYWIDKSIKESSLFFSYYLSLEDAIKRAEEHADTDYRNWKKTYKNNIPIVKR